MADVITDLLGAEVAELLGFSVPKPRQEYPCQAEPMKDPPPRLMTFLYLLARDKLAVGAIEALMISARDAPGTKGCNPHLDQLARSYCQVLVGGEHESLEQAHEALQSIRERLEEHGRWTGNGYESVDRVVSDLRDRVAQAERMNAEIERLRGALRDQQAGDMKLSRYEDTLRTIAEDNTRDVMSRSLASAALGEHSDVSPALSSSTDER